MPEVSTTLLFARQVLMPERNNINSIAEKDGRILLRLKTDNTEVRRRIVGLLSVSSIGVTFVNGTDSGPALRLAKLTDIKQCLSVLGDAVTVRNTPQGKPEILFYENKDLATRVTELMGTAGLALPQIRLRPLGGGTDTIIDAMPV